MPIDLLPAGVWVKIMKLVVFAQSIIINHLRQKLRSSALLSLVGYLRILSSNTFWLRYLPTLFFYRPVLSLFLSFSLPDVLCDPIDLIWNKGTPFEAMTGRTAPSVS